MIRTALHSGAFLLLLACGEEAKVTVVQAPNGPARVLEIPGDCPDVLDKGVSGGCATNEPVYVIFYPRGDEKARQHELEHVEELEQLRWMAHGYEVSVVKFLHAADGIDTRHQYEQFVARQRAREAGGGGR